MKYSIFSVLRNIQKNKLNTLVMILGLGISFALIIYISGYVFSELSYDQFIKDKDRIHRLYGKGVIHGRNLDMAVSAPDYAVSVKNEIPEIEETVRIFNTGNQQVKIDDETNVNIQVIRSDKNFFSFFGLELLGQISEHPLDDPNNIVISEGVAKRNYGSVENALGIDIQIVQGNSTTTFKIAGVFKDINKNFHIDFQAVQSVYVNRNFNPGTFQGEYIYTYIKTKNENIDIDALNLKLTQYQYFNAYDVPEAYEMSMADIKSYDPYLLVLTEPLKDIHFSSHKFDMAITSNKTYVIGAIILSLLVVIISFINFFNLSVASLSKRLKNFGIMRTVGAMKKNILGSLSYESVFYFALSFGLAIGLFFLLKEPFSIFTGFDIKIDSDTSQKLILIMAIFMIAFILLSELISFFIITKHSSRELISSSNQKDANRFGNLRNLFLVIQFSLSSLVIISTLIVNKQINFFAQADKGFDSENIIGFVVDQRNSGKLDAFLNELKASPYIKSVATSTRPMGEDPGMNAMYFNSISDDHYFHSSFFTVDDYYAKTYNLQLANGRFFDNEISNSYNEVIINETAAKEYMLEGEALGNYILMENNPNEYKIVGIFKDFNFRTFHHPVEPLVLRRGESMRDVSVKMNNDQIAEAIGFIQQTREKLSMVGSFNYNFVDERLANNYFKEAQFRKLLSFITILAIFISCMGLFAISQLTVIQKTKEIAIRKINGAKIPNITTYLINKFVKWIVVALVVTTPMAWFLMTKWLESFSYRTHFSWWLFALAGLITIMVAVTTVFLQVLRAAGRNPVEALRYE